MRAVIWKELRNVALRAAKVKLPSVDDGLHKVPDAGYQLEDGREILGFSTNEPEKMAGFSGPEQLFLLDEASGIPEEIFEAIEGNRAGGVVIVMFSNPTRTSGEFFESHHRKAKSAKNPSGYLTFRLSSEEAAEVDPHIPGLARREWILEKQNEWGRDSSLYGVRILGTFPQQGASSVVPLHLVVTAVERGRTYRSIAPAPHPGSEDYDDFQALEAPALKDDPTDRLEVGVDVARSGMDKSSIVLRRGPVAWRPVRFMGLDGPQLAAEVLKLIDAHRRPHDAAVPPRVKVDANGVGASVFDALAAYATSDQGSGKLLVIGVMSSAAPTAKPREYANVRAQMWFELSAWLRTGAIAADDVLEADITTPEFKFARDRRLLVESKDDIKKRLGRSPDDGDALCLAVYDPPDFTYAEATADDFIGIDFTR